MHVLAARAVDRRREGSRDTPHYQIHLTDNAGTHYRAAVNVEPQQAPSELLYLADDDFRHPVTELPPPAGSGWTALVSQAGKASLDFIRGNMFDPASMRMLPPDVEGADNDLADLLDHYVQRAIADPTATLYVFGQRFGPEANIADKVFGFRPGNGVHDIHMNQGNSGRFRSDNGVWQDGALFVHLPAENRWVAIFLAFRSQAWHTADDTGHPPPPSARDGPSPSDTTGTKAPQHPRRPAKSDLAGGRGWSSHGCSRNPVRPGSAPSPRRRTGAARVAAPSVSDRETHDHGAGPDGRCVRRTQNADEGSTRLSPSHRISGRYGH
ncbi:DUF2278 family protein [Streptomyces sp. NBC_01276]